MSNTLKVQEGLAVFIEATYFMLGCNDYYKEFINNLRNENKKYYGYVEPLCFILEYMKDVDYNTKLFITHAVFQIALKSMNACIYNYEGKLFASNKSIKKMISKQDFSKEYLPNKTFQAMIKACKNETTYENFQEKLLSFAKMEENNSIEQYSDRLKK